MLCRKCGVIMKDDWGQAYQYHSTCWPDEEPLPGFDGMTPKDIEMRDDLIDIVKWKYNNATRSLQTALGCSEVGHPCDRRVGYKMAGIAHANHNADPWPAVVGTAIHTWMETAVNDYQAAHSLKRWVTELEVHPSPLVKGHTDLYDRDRKAVLDWKFPSPDNLKGMRKNGPSDQYMIQVHLYGLGHVRAGREVKRVGIISLGRQGWLRDLYVHTVPFDQAVAEQALERVYALGRKLNEIDILSHPELWDDVEAKPDKHLCTFCPWFVRNALTADDKGCPGS